MRILFFILTCLIVVGTAFRAGAADPLPKLTLDPGATTVSGLSSGGFMAVQLETAFSSAIAGAGIVAGGPYGCAEDSVYTAVYGCLVPPIWMSWWPGTNAEVTLRTIKRLEGKIDPTAGLVADRIYLYHGQSDDTVRRNSMDVLKEVYGKLNVPDANIRYVTDIDSGHGFLVEEGGVVCAVSEPDYINDCNTDQAGDILKWVYPGLQPPANAGAVPDNLIEFDQSVYTENAAGMDTTGYVYIPASCRSGQTCRLHIALHGCQQGRQTIGDEYARTTGYNRWAESNGIVVLYPQAVKIDSTLFDPFAGNPKGCWDWWGYAGKDYLTRSAPQIAAIARMAKAVGAPLAP